MTLTKLEPLQFLVNMIDLKIEKPKEPEPIKCKKCNSLIHAYYVDPEFWNGRILSFSNIWKFSSETCDVCLKKLREEEEIKQEIKRNALLQEQENKRLIELLNEKGFKEFYFSSYEPTFETMVAFNACSNFDPLKDDLFLFGPAGTGKTHLAGAVIRNFKDSFFIKHAQLNRAMPGLKNEQYESKLNNFISYPVLVVDDLGTAKQTDYADQVLYEILDGRMMSYQHGMIITSNLSLNDLAKRFGDDRLVSRIAGMCKTIKLDGQDWRLKK